MSQKLISLAGMVVILALGWACSMNRKKFPWRTVVAGLLLQFVFALLILKTPSGAALFAFAQKAVTKLIGFAELGSKMVFGPLADGPLLTEKLGQGNSFIFVITVTATIILVSSLSSALYHYGILQRIVRAIAWVMQRVMRTSGSESLAAAANVFMGQTEAPLVIKPYLAAMTSSELMALMVGGMATIAGGVLAAYVSFGVPAGHLLTASVMSAPASLMLAKILLPETELSPTKAGASAEVERETRNGVDALCRGASEGMTLAINVMAMLIAFVAVVALANYLFTYAQRQLGVPQPVTLQGVVGWLHVPLAWIMSVPAKDCAAIGQVLGERVILNEFMAYLSLAKLKESVEPRSFVLATYALCGFANFASIAIQIGGIGALAPTRRSQLAQLGFRAMLGGLLACYLTATVVGLLI